MGTKLRLIGSLGKAVLAGCLPLAAKNLGMTFRSLRYRLKKFGLDTEDDE